MCKISVVFEIELPIEKAENKISIREISHGKASDCPPFPNLFIINGLSNDCTSESMCDAIHKIMLTWKG